MALFLLPKIQYIFNPKKEREAIEKDKEWRKQPLKNWQKANYIPVGHTDAFKKAVEEFIQQHKSAHSLTTTQWLSLTTAIAQFIYAHYDGSGENRPTLP